MNGKTEHPDINDTLRQEGPDAVRARHDQAHSTPKAREYPDAFDETIDDPHDYEPDDPRNYEPGSGGNGRAKALPFIDMSTWDSTPTSARQWYVLDHIPSRQPTLISGEGSIGKSICSLQLLGSILAVATMDRMFGSATRADDLLRCRRRAGRNSASARSHSRISRRSLCRSDRRRFQVPCICWQGCGVGGIRPQRTHPADGTVRETSTPKRSRCGRAPS